MSNDVLEKLMATFPRKERNALQQAAYFERLDDAFVAKRDSLLADIKTRGADTLIVALAFASAQHQMERGEVLPSEVLSDLLGGAPDTVAEVLTRLVQEAK